jgi:hypothetical protein
MPCNHAHVLKETNTSHFVQLMLTPFFRELTAQEEIQDSPLSSQHFKDKF